jgi:phosphatidylserine/phosphatidylglycerophosphate/cardiolipin synthase-like enzyme
MSRLDWLATLSAADLERLEVALTSGRVRPGDRGMAFRSVGLPAAWAVELELVRDWPPGVLVEVLQAWQALRRQESRPRIEVVRTQPLTVGMDGTDTATVLRQLFLQARQEVLIAGFRLTDPGLFEPLKRPAGQELHIRLFVDLDIHTDVFGRSQAPQDPQTWPQRWLEQFHRRIWHPALPEPEVFYAPSAMGIRGEELRSMHIKTVLVDRERWLVTSANFTDRGQTRNFELGALLDGNETAASVAYWFDSLVGTGLFNKISFPER